MRTHAAIGLVLLLLGCGEETRAGAGNASGGAGGTGGVSSGGGSGGGGASGGGSGAATTGGSGGGAEADWIWGVTIDSVEPLPEITTSLGKLSKKPTTRIVFDEFVPASDYQQAATAVHGVSFVMGEILDSFYVSQYTSTEYVDRTKEYVSLLTPVVDIWEIGNEVNGEWLCGQNASDCTVSQTAEVVAKIDGAYDVVKGAGGKTALTLYYNQDCWSSPENEMFAWASKNLPAKLVQGLDYVLVSYYEEDCNGLAPNWQEVFAKLAVMFPSARLGMGECGTKDASKKAELVKQYYGMKLSETRFVGGNFWWYYRQDMVPHTQPLWAVLDGVLMGN